MRDLITPLLIAYDEAPNIGRTVNKLFWAKKVVVIDSGSVDQTLEILRRYPNVETINHSFVDFADQWNFGLSHVQSPWVLSLDADYELSDSFVEELLHLSPTDYVAGYASKFIYRVYGRQLRGTLYPDRTVLYRKDKASYKMDGHTQRVIVDGEVVPLASRIFHDDRKPLSRWISSQQHYARDEAEHLLASRSDELNWADKLRLMAWPAPIAVFFYVLFIKCCIFDGWQGWFYALQRATAEILLALELVERRLRENTL